MSAATRSIASTVGQPFARLTSRWLTGVAVCLLLGGCATPGGYPNHATAQDVVESEKPAQDNPQMYLDLIRQMQKQGAYYASLAHIDAFRHRSGNPPELRRLQADALRETGQADAATAVYRGLLGSDQSAAAWHGLGLIAAAAGQYDSAQQNLLKAVQLEPINVAYLGDLGYARLCADQLALAHEPLAKAAELEPGNVKAIANLALWALLRGDHAQAEAIMQKTNMPQPARDAVQKLAIQLRASAQARRSENDAQPVNADTPAPAPAPAKRSMPKRVPPPQVAGIPGSMLDRFDTSPAISEAHP